MTRKGIILSVFFASALLLWPENHIGAQDLDTLGLRVYFRQSEYVIDDSFRSNGDAIAKFTRDVNAVLADPGVVIHSIAVETGTSPEGGVKYNEDLAMKRARAIRKRLVDNLALSPSQIKAYTSGINWEGLVSVVRDGDCPWRNEILAVVAEHSVRTEYDIRREEACRNALMAIDDGKAWKWMSDNVFTDLRLAAGSVRCIISRDDTPVRDTLVIIHEYEGPDAAAITTAAAAAAVSAVTSASRQDEEKPVRTFRRDSLFRVPVFAFRTNLLLPLMNVGFEVPIGNRWSIEGDWYSPWIFRQWMNSVQPFYSTCVEMQGAFLCGRVWLGRKHSTKTGDPRYRLRGHSIGFGLGACHYDLGWNYEGRQGDAIALGVDYKYALPIGDGGVHFEFTVGVCGYYELYQMYKIGEIRYADDGVTPMSADLLSTSDRSQKIFVAPFKLGVSLVVPIFERRREQ